MDEYIEQTLDKKKKKKSESPAPAAHDDVGHHEEGPAPSLAMKGTKLD